MNVRSGTLEVHIPISPTPFFFTMVRYYAATLRRNGGPFADARIVVSVGEDCDAFDVAAAHPELAAYHIEWRWADREYFRRFSYGATVFDRWAAPFESEYVLIADADMLIVKDFSDVVKRMRPDREIAGVIATWPPFAARGFGNVDRQRWLELFRLAGLGEPPMDCRHPGYGSFYGSEFGIAEAPPYYNLGFVLGTRDAMNAIRGTVRTDVELAFEYMQTDLAAQAGLTLSIVRNNLRYTSLPVRYNFWSWAEYLKHFPDEARDVRVFHYLLGPFQKHVDTVSHETIGQKVAEWKDDPEPIKRFVAMQFARAHDIVSADENVG